MEKSILYYAHRCAEDGIHATRAQVLAEAGPDADNETEPVDRVGIRYADRTSAREAIACNRFAIT
jgi:hypothetical protein